MLYYDHKHKSFHLSINMNLRYGQQSRCSRAEMKTTRTPAIQPGASAPPGSSLKMQSLRPQPRLTKSICKTQCRIKICRIHLETHCSLTKSSSDSYTHEHKEGFSISNGSQPQVYVRIPIELLEIPAPKFQPRPVKSVYWRWDISIFKSSLDDSNVQGSLRTFGLGCGWSILLLT